MSTRTKLSLLLVVTLAAQSLTIRTEAAPLRQTISSDIEMAWRSEPFNVIETTPAERQRIAASIDSAPALAEDQMHVLPEATFSDSVNDLLFRWLSPENADYGLSIEGATARSNAPLAALGFTSPSFYWSAVTFNRYDPNLAAYDWIPDFGSNWWNGVPASYSDGVNSTVPSFADLRTIGIARNGADTQWTLTSAADLPGLPTAYQLGYNFNVESGGQRLQQFIGATAFTPSGWYWSIRDRGNLFPGWNSNLDVTEVIVAQPTQDTVQFEAKVAGTLRSTYGSTEAWPRFYWYLDKDNNTATGDNFTFGYQEGSYVFTYVLNGIDSVVEVLYDERSNQWLAILRTKTGPGKWETVRTAAPVLFQNNRIRVVFNRADTGVYATFRWGLVSWFRMSRGGQFFSGNVDVAPNAGMQTQTLTVDPNQALAERYAPVFYQASTTDYHPVSVNYTLYHSTLHCGGVPKTQPTLNDLANCTDSDAHLDLNGTNAKETWEKWLQSSGRDLTMFARVYPSGNQRSQSGAPSARC